MARNAKRMKLDAITEDDRIIALVGPTGSGKTTFICTATGQNGKQADHKLEPRGSKIRAVRHQHPTSLKHYVLVDTPGFDDTDITDTKVLTLIADWLKKTCKKKVKLAGIIYLHHISDSCMSGISALKDLHMFLKLCGDGAIRNVVLATTMWTKVKPEVGERREKQLKDTYWRGMLAVGSRMMRFDDSFDTAWKMLDDIVNAPEIDKEHALLLQKLVVDLNRPFWEMITEDDRIIALMGPSRAGKSNLFSRQDTNTTAEHSWRAKSATVEREPEDPVKRFKNSNARTDSSWRDSSSTQGRNREDRGEHGLPLYLSRRVTPPKRQRVPENYKPAFISKAPNAIIPGPSTEPSRDSGILMPGWHRKSPAKHDSGFSSKPSIAMNYEASEPFIPSRELRHSPKHESLRASTSRPSSTKASTRGGTYTPDGEQNDQRKHELVFDPLEVHSVEDAVITRPPDLDSQETSETTLYQTSTPPPPSRNSFNSANKPKSALRNFFKRQQKTPNELPLSERKVIKSDSSATTSVTLGVEDPSEDQVIIALIGPTGSGKSSFIGTATGNDVGIGYDMESCTTEINMVKLDCVYPLDLDIVFLDTPGFDDTSNSDTEIMDMLSKWLNKTYQSNVTLAGILYFQRISDNRTTGRPLKHLRMFRKLCGRMTLDNVILVTTMWDEVEEDEGSQREEELKGKYWKAMIDQGSVAARYHGTLDSAWDIVEHFTTQRQAALLQREMDALERQLPETTDSRELYATLEGLIRKQQDNLQKIRVETKRHENEQDQGILHALKSEYDAVRQQLEITMNEMQNVKLPLGKHLLRFVWTPIGLTGSKSW